MVVYCRSFSIISEEYGGVNLTRAYPRVNNDSKAAISVEFYITDTAVRSALSVKSIVVKTYQSIPHEYCRSFSIISEEYGGVNLPRAYPMSDDSQGCNISLVLHYRYCRSFSIISEEYGGVNLPRAYPMSE
ncbi:hypothetical protein J6590_079540 [Homalodisca vitripennis]|nr:hypothetical protein J6590_079540 [Homalodisca vitripennis]